MSDVSTAAQDSSSNPGGTNSSGTPPIGKYKSLRIWPPLLLLAVMAALCVIPRMMDEASFALVMASALGPVICGLLIMMWWLLLSRATVIERFVGLLGAGVAFGVSLLLLDKSMFIAGVVLVTIPVGTAAFAIGAILRGGVLSFQRTIVAVLCAACGFGFSDLLRSDGLWGEFASLELAWRWQASSEERMLAEQKDRAVTEGTELTSAEVDLWLANPEWPGFRGADRSGRQQGPPLSADWVSSPPEEIWKISVGPGWSSFAVAGNLLFTQEQRGPKEVIACYAADSGREIWTQSVESRFYESMGGAGPRATPTLADGKLFVLGANGHLLRLDPKTGHIDWQVDLQKIAERTPPIWGFSSSPLVVGSQVIVHAGGQANKGTLAFDVETGELNWGAAGGDHSYSSPQLGTLAGQDFVLMLTNTGLVFLDPQSGAERLFYDWKYEGYRVLQPQLLGGDSVLLSTGAGVGARRIRVSERDGNLVAEDVWTSMDLKPEFNDLVIYQGHAYGFDGAIFTCVDLETGERAWKGGRYGKGQVLLLANSGLLLVASENGEVVLLKADPSKHQELAKFRALEGKTWNHPVVIGDRLYHRNAQQAVCYRLPLAKETMTASPAD